MVVASDLYALGGTLFYMLTGRHVFQKDRREPLSFMNAHMNDVVPDVQVIKPGVPADLAQLIYRMLAKDHNARGTAAELLVEFKKLVPREVPLTPPPATKSTRSPLTAKELAPSVTTAKPRRPSAAPEAKVQNPLVRAADVVLSLVERIFIPDDVRPQAGDELGFAERLMALLRRPLVLVLIFAVMLVIVLIVLI
jgi:serine/threonine protein kinase